MKNYRMHVSLLVFLYVTFLSFSISLAQVEWEISDSPIVSPGNYYEWDGERVYDPAIILDNGFFHMWYVGYSNYSGEQWSIGYATSTDGYTWMKYQDNPVISHHDYLMAHPCIRKENGLFHIYLVSNTYGYNKRIYQGTSVDGIDWDIDLYKPALDLGEPGQWDDNNVHNPYVIHDGTEYKMYYSGEDGWGTFQIGVATSTDGENWYRYQSNPILQAGYFQEWDSADVNNPCVYYDGYIYHMWYNGFDGYSYAVGYAVSVDGFQWEKHPDNPIITPGTHWWCSDRIGCGAVLAWDDALHMVPSGSDGYHHYIGMGTSGFELEDILIVDLIPNGRYFKKGENLGFTFRIENLSQEEQTFDTWMDFYLFGFPFPGNPIRGPIEITLPPQDSLEGYIEKPIPTAIPLGGPYSLHLKTGIYPDDIWAEDSFEFFIVP